MPTLKKPVKKAAKQEKVPMFHVNDRIQFDVDGTETEATITSVDNDEETVECVTDEGDDYTCGFDEISPVESKPKKPAKKAGPAKEEEEEEKPKKKSKSTGKGDSLAGAFNRAKAANATTGLPAGKYEALVVAVGINETEKGISGSIKYTVVNDELEGKSTVAFYQLLDKDGEELQGLEFFKRDLLSLGLDEDADFGDRDELEEALQAIANKNVWVKINVREKDGYTNTFLQSVFDEQDDKPELPE